MLSKKEIILKNIPKDCYWEDMDNLTNTPIHYIENVMDEYLNQYKDGLSKENELADKKFIVETYITDTHFETINGKITLISQHMGTISSGETEEECWNAAYKYLNYTNK